MPVVYQVVGFGRGDGRHSDRHGQSVLLLLLHDLYSANFEDRVEGAGVARWRTWLTGEGEKVGF